MASTPEALTESGEDFHARTPLAAVEQPAAVVGRRQSEDGTQAALTTHSEARPVCRSHSRRIAGTFAAVQCGPPRPSNGLPAQRNSTWPWRHLDPSERAYERGEWEAANEQQRTFLEAVYEGVAQLVLGQDKKRGEACRR